MSSWQLPVGQFSPQDRDSFAYPTVVKRWPTILTNVISSVSSVNHELQMRISSSQGGMTEKEREEATRDLEQGKEIIRRLSGLKHDMGRDRKLEPIPSDSDDDASTFNHELSILSTTTPNPTDTWFTAPWLFAECYLYRLIRSFFAQKGNSKRWLEFDPFFESKKETYRQSSVAIVHLAKSLKALESKREALLAEGWQAPGSALEIVFLEMMQASLWGNATDLSLLVDLKYEDLQALQSVGAAAQQENAKFILRNDLPKVWERVKTLERGARVDFVLDNAGFELYTDLILADFLVSHTGGLIGQVVFHPKAIPWFVSDTLPYDFTWAIDTLADRDFFASTSPPPTSSELDLLQEQQARWRRHLADGRFKLSVPLDAAIGQPTPIGGFWTTPYPYQLLPEKDPKLLADLQKSSLVIFKGDLNYRKLLADGKWPATTPFTEVLGPLNGKIDVLSLRTNKADPIAGLNEGIDARLDQEAPDWRVSGRYAVVSFAPRT